MKVVSTKEKVTMKKQLTSLEGKLVTYLELCWLFLSKYSFSVVADVNVVETHRFNQTGVLYFARLARRPYEEGAKLLILNSQTERSKSHKTSSFVYMCERYCKWKESPKRGSMSAGCDKCGQKCH